MTNKAIFLDSDGVLNVAPIKNGKPAAPTSLGELQIPNEVKPALERLKAAGYLLFCVTNKPDVARGHMTKADVEVIYIEMQRQLPLDEVFICYDEDSENYKPKPGMLLTAAKKYDLDLTQSYMIGDRWKDIAAGKSAGCKTVWIDRGYAEQKPEPAAEHTTKCLTEAVEYVLKLRP